MSSSSSLSFSSSSTSSSNNISNNNNNTTTTISNMTTTISNNNNNNNNTKAALDRGISTILNGNFDADSKVCLVTLIKLLDNLLQQPENANVRSIRKQNKTFHSKVVAKGGVDFLLACGFMQQDEFLVLVAHDEHLETLVTARHLLTQVAIHQLQCPPSDLPRFVEPKPKPTISSSSNATTSNAFNVYQGHRYDGQSAAVGTNLGPPANWKSATDTKLETLQQQQVKLQQSLQTTLDDRQWMATGPPKATAMMVDDNTTTTTTSNNDSQLLASHLQKQQQQRMAADQRGFTTKAMRDLERLKTQKVYSHSQLEIRFADGCWVKGNFLPKETIQDVLDSLQEQVFVNANNANSTKSFALELYLTPPRTLLPPTKTLQALGLVPAAKVYVSWKQPMRNTTTTTTTTTTPGWYIRPALFLAATNGIVPAVPQSALIVASLEEADRQKKKSTTATAKRKKLTKAEKESNLLKRMLGN